MFLKYFIFCIHSSNPLFLIGLSFDLLDIFNIIINIIQLFNGSVGNISKYFSRGTDRGQ